MFIFMHVTCFLQLKNLRKRNRRVISAGVGALHDVKSEVSCNRIDYHRHSLTHIMLTALGTFASNNSLHILVGQCSRFSSFVQRVERSAGTNEMH